MKELSLKKVLWRRKEDAVPSESQSLPFLLPSLTEMMWAMATEVEMGRGRAPALAQGDLRFPSPFNAVGGGAEESFSGWDAPLRPRNALNIPLLRMAEDITFQPAGWPMTGPEKDAHHWGGEGRGGESPAPTSFRRKPPPHPPAAQLLLRLLPPARAWQMGSRSVPGRGFWRKCCHTQ